MKDRSQDYNYLQDMAVNLLAANGNFLISESRINSQAYLLDCCGAELGLKFTYKEGPYCPYLLAGAEDALAEGRISKQEHVTTRHKIHYSMFISKESTELQKPLASLSGKKACDLVKEMNQVGDTVLSLAARIVFLRDEWHYFDKANISPVDEARSRNPLTGTDENIEKAISLLRTLGLDQNLQPSSSPTPQKPPSARKSKGASVSP